MSYSNLNHDRIENRLSCRNYGRQVCGMARFSNGLMNALLSVSLLGGLALGTEIEVLTLKEGVQFDEVVYAQESVGTRLTLNANACFFYPIGPRLQDGGKVSDDEEAALFNKGERYSGIGMLRNPGQQVKWPILPVANGEVSLKVFLKANAKEAGSEWIVRCGDIEQHVTSVKSDGTSPQPWSLSGRIVQSGIRKESIQYVTLELVSTRSKNVDGGVLRSVELSGPTMKGAYLLRSRWRPQAVHTRFYSTEQLDTELGIQAWVVEVRPHFDFGFDPFQFYAPVTTEFGYYGSTYMPTSEETPDLFTAKPMNFSLWSYKRGVAEPPVGEMSHLLALGDPKRQFGGYHHEGTGVKPRGPLPQIENQRMRSLVVGMRFDAPNASDPYPYRTYHSYFVNPENGEWMLYASGRQFTDEPDKYGGLREPGAFVEVPGRVVSQRTHQSLRSASYRGWIQDLKGAWHPIDTMKGSTKIGEIAPKRWELSDDGWFSMTTGGIVYRRFKTKKSDVVHTPSFALPGYMTEKAMEQFSEHPVSVEVHKVTKGPDGNLIVDFELLGNEALAEVVLHYGRQDGLTLIFEDGDQPSKWEGTVSKRFAPGKHRWEILDPGKGGFSEQGFCRLLINAEEGRFWALESSEWNGDRRK